MLYNVEYEKAIEMLLNAVRPVGTEEAELSLCGGRILAAALSAKENVPAFDRSPYDGYAVRAEDTKDISKENPICLKIIEKIPAGSVPKEKIVPGTAAKVLTGAPIPEGADAVIMYEKTRFTDETVTLFSPLCSGDNIIRAGEDVMAGAVLAEQGTVIDAGLSGTLAAQGISRPLVYRIPKVAVISTGSELVEADEIPENGKIRNTNRYMFETVLRKIGCEPVYLGIAGDSVEKISELVSRGAEECDAVITTGGVSVGDYDLSPEAMEKSGIRLLFCGADIKPGMACAYGIKNGKLICGLSGNPASSLINFYVAALPAMKKLTGRREFMHEIFPVKLLQGFKKKSPKTRFLRGKLCFQNGQVCMEVPQSQGNVVLSSAVGCNMMAVIPAGSGPIAPGTVLRGFMI